MSTVRKSWFQLMVSMATVVALVGCSALQIDVDVYKGPLVSQREVQLRQFAVLAVAAKPLLMSLRDKAEGPNWDGSAEAIRSEGFSDHVFSDSLAKFTNGVLSYYDDLPSAEVSRLASTVAYHNALYQNILKSFNPLPDDCSLANQVKAAQAQNSNDSFNALRDQVILFLQAGSTRAVDASGKCLAHGSVPTSVRGPSRELEKLLFLWERLCKDKQLTAEACVEDKDDKGVTSGYYRLSEGKLALALGKVVFPASVKNAAELSRRTSEIGRLFVEGRTQLTHILESATELLATAGRRKSSREIEVAAEAVANATQVKMLSCLIERHGVSLHPLMPRLQENLRPLQNFDWAAPDASDKAEAIILQAAINDPIGMASVIKQAHQSLKGQPPQNANLCAPYRDVDRLTDALFASSLHGLARGTQTDNEFDTALQRVSDKLLGMTRPTTMGFDKGRTTQGLETLTRLYMEAVERKSTDREDESEEVKKTRRQLEEMLIAFAERVLYVVNNYDQLPVHAANGYSIAPYSNDEMREVHGTSHDTQKDYRPLFARSGSVLQDVGNTIIVLIDDIRRQDDHERRLVSRLEGEQLAARGAFDLTLPQIYDQLTRQVEAAMEEDTPRIKDLKAEQTPLGKKQLAMVAEAQTLQGEAARKEQAASDAKAKLETMLLDNQPLLAAFRTFVAVEKTQAWSRSLVVDKFSNQDKIALRQHLAKLDTNTDAGAVIDASIQFLEGQITKAPPSEQATPRITRLQMTKTYLADHSEEFGDITVTVPSKLLDQVSARIKKSFDQVARRMDEQDKEQKQAAAQARQARKVADQQDKDLAATTHRIASLQSSIDTSTITQTEREQTLQVLSVIRSDVFAKISGPSSDGQTLLATMKQVIQAKTDDITGTTQADNTKKAALIAARQHLNRVTLGAPPGFLSKQSGKPTHQRNQKDVLDDLIASLRQKQIAAASESRPTDALEKALKIAYEQRADTAYLRPASAYLRNVYAATSLIDKAEVNQRNLLPSMWTLPQSSDENVSKSRLNIEKQFWQNINTVSLRGAIASNYVIVKDDVGNWYVKAYVSDPTSLIQSAQNLALFNMGAKVDVNLLRRLELQRRADDKQLDGTERDRARDDLAELKKVDPAASGASVMGLKRVQKRYADDYAKRAALDAEALRDSLSSLKTDLRVAWERDLAVGEESPALPDGLVPYTSADADEVKTALKLLTDAEVGKPVGNALQAEQNIDSGRLADAIVDGLRQIKRMRIRLVSTIQGQANLIEAAENDVTSAEGELKEVEKEDLGKLEAEVRAKREAVNIALGEKEPEILDNAKKELDAVETALNAAKTKLDNAKQDVVDARAAKKKALEARRTAADTASNLLSNAIASLAKRRIEAVKQLETAIGFIGEVATEK